MTAFYVCWKCHEVKTLYKVGENYACKDHKDLEPPKDNLSRRTEDFIEATEQ